MIKRDFDISYGIIIYFIMSMIYQIFFVNAICKSLPWSDFWSCWFYIAEALLAVIAYTYVIVTTSRTVNMIFSFSVITCKALTVLYFGFLLFKPENYLDWSSSREIGTIMSLFFWTMGLIASVLKYSK